MIMGRLRRPNLPQADLSGLLIDSKRLYKRRDFLEAISKKRILVQNRGKPAMSRPESMALPQLTYGFAAAILLIRSPIFV